MENIMLIVKSEHPLSTRKNPIFSVMSCNEVIPIVGSEGIVGLSCIVWGADNQSGNSFESTIRFGQDHSPPHVYVENSNGKTIQHYCG